MGYGAGGAKQYKPAVPDYYDESGSGHWYLTAEEKEKAEHEKSTYGKLSSAYKSEEAKLEEYKKLERERLQSEYQQGLASSQYAVSGQVAGSGGAFLREGSAARGQQARYGAQELASQVAMQDMYFNMLEQELLARGASYEEIAMALADEQYRLGKEKEATEAEEKAQADAESAAENERAAAAILGVIGAGFSSAKGGA
jgi:hypothetical protein